MEEPTSTEETPQQIIEYDRDGRPILPEADSPTSENQ